MSKHPSSSKASRYPLSLPSAWVGVAIPDQEGVLRVGGRAGTARGPWAARALFEKFRSGASVTQSCAGWEVVNNLTQDVAENHRLAIDVVEHAQTKAPRSVVIGGGHDHGFTHLEGIRRHLRKTLGREPRLGCINLDAHLDVRKPAPEITSGSPFYLVLENQTVRAEDLIEFGIQTQSNAPDLWTYIHSKKVPVILFEELSESSIPDRFRLELERLAERCDQVVISLDLDSVEQAHAPGVSAPQSEGFTPRELLSMMRIAGAHPKVSSLGIFELNPEHDIEQRTARLAATAMHHFLEAAAHATPTGKA